MATKQQEQQAGRTQIVKDYKAGIISKDEASQRIRDLDRALFQGGGGGSVAGKSPQEISAEANRLRQQQEQEQAKVREQIRVSAEAKVVQEQAEIQRQQIQERNVIIGSASQTSRFEFQNGRSVETTSPTLRKNIGESEAAYRFRQQQLGASIRAEQPEDVKRYEEAVKQQKQAEVKATQQSIIDTKNQPVVRTGFGSKYGGGWGGTFFAFSDLVFQKTAKYIPDNAKLSIPLFSITGAGGGRVDMNIKDVLYTEVPSSVISTAVSTSDIFLKSLFFSPLISTATASKQETVVKSERQILNEYIQQQKAKDILGKFEEIYISKGKVGVEKELLRLGQSGKVDINDLTGVTKVLIERGLVNPPSSQATFNIIQPPTRTGELTIDIKTLLSPKISNIEQPFVLSNLYQEKTTPNLYQEKTTPNINSLLQNNLPSQNQLPAILSLTRGSTLQKQMPKLNQLPKQLSLQNQLPKQKQLQNQLQNQLQLQIPKLKQNLRQDYRFASPSFPKQKYKPKKELGFAMGFFKTPKLPKQPKGAFTVFGRRFGKFKAIGTSATERGAFAIGKKFAGSTLGVSFKVPGSKVLKLPGFRTKKEKGSVLFIEPRGRRLKKRGSEVLEIQQFKKVSKRRTKK